MHPYYTATLPNTPGIYKITCVSNQKFYIGSAVNLRTRRKCHFGALQRNEHRNPSLQAAFNKYGPDAFLFDVVEYVLLPELLLTREQYYFDTLQPFGKRGFNIDRVAGSSIGRTMSQASRDKSRATQLGRPSTRIGWKPTPEQVEHHRLYMTGYKHTEEAKHNMGNARRGKVHSPETREKIRIASIGHVNSPETRAKIAEASRGRTYTPESRAKMSATGKARQRTPEEYAKRLKTLIATSPDGVEYVVHGIDKFCKEHGLDGSSLTKVAKGKYKHHHGWTARYPDVS